MGGRAGARALGGSVNTKWYCNCLVRCWQRPWRGCRLVAERGEGKVAAAGPGPYVSGLNSDEVVEARGPRHDWRKNVASVQLWPFEPQIRDCLSQELPMGHFVSIQNNSIQTLILELKACSRKHPG